MEFCQSGNVGTLVPSYDCSARSCIIMTLFPSLQNSDSNATKGIDYMYMAAKAGCRSAMIHMAKAYETGIGLSSDRYVNTPD